jgi:type III secretory pathway component EscR
LVVERRAAFTEQQHDLKQLLLPSHLMTLQEQTLRTGFLLAFKAVSLVVNGRLYVLGTAAGPVRLSSGA